MSQLQLLGSQSRTCHAILHFAINGRETDALKHFPTSVRTPLTLLLDSGLDIHGARAHGVRLAACNGQQNIGTVAQLVPEVRLAGLICKAESPGSVMHAVLQLFGHACPQPQASCLFAAH